MVAVFWVDCLSFGEFEGLLAFVACSFQTAERRVLRTFNTETRGLDAYILPEYSTKMPTSSSAFRIKNHSCREGNKRIKQFRFEG